MYDNSVGFFYEKREEEKIWIFFFLVDFQASPCYDAVSIELGLSLHAILCKLFKNPLEQHTLTVAVVLLIRNPFSHVITVGIWDFMK